MRVKGLDPRVRRSVGVSGVSAGRRFRARGFLASMTQHSFMSKDISTKFIWHSNRAYQPKNGSMLDGDSIITPSKLPTAFSTIQTQTGARGTARQ